MNEHVRIILREISTSFTSTDIHLLDKLHTRRRIQSGHSEKIFGCIEDEFWTHNLWNDFFVFFGECNYWHVIKFILSFQTLNENEMKGLHEVWSCSKVHRIRRWPRSTCGCLTQHEVPTKCFRLGQLRRQKNFACWASNFMMVANIVFCKKILPHCKLGSFLHEKAVAIISLWIYSS